MGMTNGVTPILGLAWADPSSLPLHKLCLSIKGMTCRRIEVPLGEPLDPHTLSSSALTVLWGFSQKTKKSFGKYHKSKPELS